VVPGPRGDAAPVSAENCAGALRRLPGPLTTSQRAARLLRSLAYSLAHLLKADRKLLDLMHIDLICCPLSCIPRDGLDHPQRQQMRPRTAASPEGAIGAFVRRST
jgi:hypothetical protein